MDKQQIREQCAALFHSVSGNRMLATDTDAAEYVTAAFFDAPLVGFGSADDALFESYKSPDIIGPWHMSPAEWQPGAKSIISLFFPMSEAVIESNRAAKEKASTLWACARIEGQDYIHAYTEALCAWFREQGYDACAPCIDPRFQKVSEGIGIDGYPQINERTFGSRWSERHAAFVCGLGTFALSKGMITQRGIAGRFTSVIVTAPLEADKRPYTGIYEYCTHCGACVRRCPVSAISLESGKDHTKCRQHLKLSSVILHPRYGCGLCQTKVPCERSIPLKRKGT